MKSRQNESEIKTTDYTSSGIEITTTEGTNTFNIKNLSTSSEQDPRFQVIPNLYAYYFVIFGLTAKAPPEQYDATLFFSVFSPITPTELKKAGLIETDELYVNSVTTGEQLANIIIKLFPDLNISETNKVTLPVQGFRWDASGGRRILAAKFAGITQAKNAKFILYTWDDGTNWQFPLDLKIRSTSHSYIFWNKL